MSSDERRAQLQYARALLQRGRYGEILRRTAAAVRLEIQRLIGRSDEQAYRRWLAELEADRVARWTPAEPVLVSLLMPPGPADRHAFSIRSVERQTWTGWEVVPGRTIDEMVARARGTFVAMLMPGDSLLPRALEQAVEALTAHPQAPMLYTDEGVLDATGRALHPRFKPDWSPNLLLSLPYTGQLSLFRRDAVLRAGSIDGRRSPAAQLYDLTLRVAEQAPPLHLPSLLYQRRLPTPAPASSEWIDVVEEALARRHVDAEVEPGLVGPSSVAVRRRLHTRPRVAILVPFRNRPDLLERCVASIRERSTYDNYEIVAVDNRSDDRRTLALIDQLERTRQIRVLRYEQPFNFAAINNFAAERVDAEQLVLLNNDTEVISGDWIEALLEHADRPEVGIVGARLLYPDGRLQHAGVVLGLRGLAGHPFDGTAAGGAEATEAAGTGAEVLATREVSAVTAACAMIRRALYLEVGGMDATRFAIGFNDVDLCLRLRAAGLEVIYTPHALLYHHTSASRGRESNLDEDEHLTGRWSAQLRNDPYYNPNLSLRDAYRPRFCERII